MKNLLPFLVCLFLPLCGLSQLLKVDDSYGDSGTLAIDEHPDKRTYFQKPIVFENGDVVIPWIVDGKLYFTKTDADGQTISSFGSNGTTTGFPLTWIENTKSNQAVYFVPKPDGGIIGISRVYSYEKKLYSVWFLCVDAKGRRDEQFGDEKLHDMLDDIGKNGTISQMSYYKNKYFIISGNYNDTTSIDNHEPFVLKVHFSGKIDEYFGDGGMAVYPKPVGKYIAILDVRILKDEQIVLIAGLSIDGSVSLGLVCLTHDGGVNHHFGKNGCLELKMPKRTLLYRDVAIRGNDIFLLIRNRGFYYEERAEIVKISSKGELDSSFGENGFFTLGKNLPRFMSPESIELHGPNYLYVTFWHNAQQFHIWKYSRDGSGNYAFVDSELLDVSDMYPTLGTSKLWFQKQGKLMISLIGYQGLLIQRFVDDQAVERSVPASTSTNLAVYPSPFSDQIQLKLKANDRPETVLWKLTGLDGRNVEQGFSITNGGVGTIRPETNLEPGVYVLTLVCNEKTVSQKVIKR